MKCIRPDVIVGEDLISSSTGFSIDRVLSTLDHKAKVLSSRRERPPFSSMGLRRSARVMTQIVVPSDARIVFKVPAHAKTRPVRTLTETVEKYRQIAAESECFRDGTARREIRNAWISYRDASARGQRQTHRHLGRFDIRRQLPTERDVYEYFAVDEPPCQMEVLLREFPFDPALPASELERYLLGVARETRVLMKVRHPFIACVIGHFQTGASWVQVSDWFDGERLEDLWSMMKEVSVLEKIGIFMKVVQALQFCHEKGVFHRNIGAATIRIKNRFV